MSNPANVGDAAVTLGAAGGNVVVTLENFDDAAFTDVVFTMNFGGSAATAVALPTTARANAGTQATFRVAGTSRPSVSATVKYTNSRTGKAGTVTASGAVTI